jgi:hypothetical protein
MINKTFYLFAYVSYSTSNTIQLDGASTVKNQKKTGMLVNVCAVLMINMFIQGFFFILIF